MKEKNLDEAMNHHSTVEKPSGNCRNGTPFISARAQGLFRDMGGCPRVGHKRDPEDPS